MDNQKALNAVEKAIDKAYEEGKKSALMGALNKSEDKGRQSMLDNIEEIITVAVMESLQFHEEFTVLTEDQTDYTVSQDDFESVAKMVADKVMDKLSNTKTNKGCSEK